MAASTHTDRYDDLTLQVALARKESADLYADDARRAYQRRIDTISQTDATAIQTQRTSALAAEIAQLRAGTSQPPVIVNPAKV
jgi:hypothetical protein